MSNETIFWTQISSIVVFLFALFSLYRLLVSQKDATIEALKERIEYWKDQLQQARQNTPDVLAQQLGQRVEILSEELRRLVSDQNAGQETIKEKQEDLKQAEIEITQMQSQLEAAEQLLREFRCPYCKAPMIHRSSYGDEVHMDSYIPPIDEIGYECGHFVVNGKTEHDCPNKNKR